MDPRIAARASVPIVAVAILGAVAVGRRAAVDAPAPLTKATKFVANCDRLDYAALEERFGRGNVAGCEVGQFGEPAAVVTTIDVEHDRAAMHVIGRDLRELVTPHDIPSSAIDSALRITDLDGDGVDEILMWQASDRRPSSYSLGEIRIRVAAVRDGALVISREHPYVARTDPMAAGRAIVANCKFD